MRILVAGGYRGGATPLCCWYDPANNVWIEAQHMGLRRDAAAAAVMGGSVYVTGGRNSEFEEENVCERFDPLTGAWTELPTLRRYRRNHAAAALGGRLYVIGGYYCGQALTSVECYEPGANEWAAGPELPVKLGQAAAFTIGGALWVVGETDEFRAFRFEATTSQWHEGPVVCRGRRWLAFTADDAAIYSFGGETSDGVASRVAERCELATGTIARMEDMPTARRSPAAVTIDHRMVVLGGDRRDGSEYADAEAFDTRTGTWQVLAPMPWAVAAATAVCLTP